MLWVSRNIFPLLYVVLTIYGMAFISCSRPNQRPESIQQDSAISPRRNPRSGKATQRIKNKAAGLLPWLRDKGYSTELMLIADMEIPMYRKRLWLLNPTTGDILHHSLMAHGSGGGSDLDNVSFSNEPGSHCSSKGRYRIGEPYTGQWGRSFRLYGLDPTNSNAYRRNVVLHYYQHLTTEPGTQNLYFSEGCAMMSKRDFETIEPRIKSARKPVILWID
jgi:hypothetical protein